MDRAKRPLWLTDQDEGEGGVGGKSGGRHTFVPLRYARSVEPFPPLAMRRRALLDRAADVGPALAGASGG